MKIGILTQPLHNNYGGLLQAYALQKVLKDMGHEVWTVDIQIKNSFIFIIKDVLVRTIRKHFLKQNIDTIFPNKPGNKEKEVIEKYTRRFIAENIDTTERIYSVKQIKKIRKYNFDAYIVGSDQVWRPQYSPGIPTFFLDFLKPEEKVKRIAYAASFGVDYWEFKPQLTKKCKKLVQRFNVISVREESAIKLCKEYLNIPAIQLVDPTLLLEKEDYVDLLRSEILPVKKNSLALYILDPSIDKQNIILKINAHLKLKINPIMADKPYSKAIKSDLEKCVFPPVSQWLKGFNDAEFVITDSFHGTVFAIIFNKPFITLANRSRGMTRFTSLLKTFNLEHRIITHNDNVNVKLLDEKINFDKLNVIRKQQQLQAFEFLSILNDGVNDGVSCN